MYNDKYKTLIRTVINTGSHQEGRNGQQKIIPAHSFTINHKDWRLNLRKMHYKGVEGEFKTLISKTPLTNVQQFRDNGCNYWDMFAEVDGSINLDYYNELQKQLPGIIEQIKAEPHSRRHVIDLWNHENLENLSLPCCWYSMIFSVIGNTINIIWNQRSCDVALGLPSDVYLAHLFLKHIAEQTGTIPGVMTFNLANVHLYEQHINNAKILLTRTEQDYNTPLKFELC